MLRLTVVCDCCGACCETVGFPPGYNTPAMVAHLPEELREPLLAQVQAERKRGSTRDGSPCAWLDTATKRCRHHDHRPRACRAFQAGTVVCDARRAEFGFSPFAVPQPEPEVWSPEPEPELEPELEPLREPELEPEPVSRPDAAHHADTRSEFEHDARSSDPAG